MRQDDQTLPRSMGKLANHRLWLAAEVNWRFKELRIEWESTMDLPGRAPVMPCDRQARG